MIELNRFAKFFLKKVRFKTEIFLKKSRKQIIEMIKILKLFMRLNHLETYLENKNK
jgi:hypothetical protein